MAKRIVGLREPRIPTGDSFTRSRAEELAADIRRYWSRKGGPQPRVWLEPITADALGAGGSGWVVRSDMRDGAPRPL